MTENKYETAAASYLQQQGVQLLQRNFRCSCGEIDIIGKDKEYLVFVEVRFRKGNSFGSAEESIDFYKQKKIIQTAQCYLAAKDWAHDLPCRFDVVALSNAKPPLKWIKDAFDA